MTLSQVTVYANQIAKQRLGYQAISLTNYDNDLEPQIAAGSKVEIGGALFEAVSDENISGWAGISNSKHVYIKLVVSGVTATAEFTDTPPTWSTSKQGWYNGDDRYVFELYKDASGNYTQKKLLTPKPWKPKVKIGNSTRNTAGDQVIADVGFKPSVVFFIGNDDTISSINVSWGFDDGTDHMCLYLFENSTKQIVSLTRSISINRDASNFIMGNISAFTPDGFTITWSLVGTVTARFFYLALP